MTTKIKRSTQNGVEVTEWFGDREVPSYVVAAGVSVDDGAKAIGLRVLGRRETGEVVAEIHERGGSSFWAVKSEAV